MYDCVTLKQRMNVAASIVWPEVLIWLHWRILYTTCCACVCACVLDGCDIMSCLHIRAVQ